MYQIIQLCTHTSQCSEKKQTFNHYQTTSKKTKNRTSLFTSFSGNPSEKKDFFFFLGGIIEMQRGITGGGTSEESEEDDEEVR